MIAPAVALALEEGVPFLMKLLGLAAAHYQAGEHPHTATALNLAAGILTPVAQAVSQAAATGSSSMVTAAGVASAVQGVQDAATALVAGAAKTS